MKCTCKTFSMDKRSDTYVDPNCPVHGKCICNGKGAKCPQHGQVYKAGIQVSTKDFTPVKDPQRYELELKILDALYKPQIEEAIRVRDQGKVLDPEKVLTEQTKKFKKLIRSRELQAAREALTDISEKLRDKHIESFNKHGANEGDAPGLQVAIEAIEKELQSGEQDGCPECGSPIKIIKNPLTKMCTNCDWEETL